MVSLISISDNVKTNFADRLLRVKLISGWGRVTQFEVHQCCIKSSRLRIKRSKSQLVATKPQATSVILNWEQFCTLGDCWFEGRGREYTMESIWVRPGMLLKVLQCTGPSTAKNYVAKHVSSMRLRNPGLDISMFLSFCVFIL